MKVLVTSAASEAGQMLAAALQPGHDVSLTDLPANAGDGIIACELGPDEPTDELVQGIGAIVHVAYQGRDDDATALLDYHCRCTYNLLTAASQAGVKRVVNVSTLRLLQDYEENLTVTERWRSLPPADDVELLSAHLCEVVCREFARDRLIQVVNLRLGWPIVEGDVIAAASTGETAALCTEDLSTALNAALTADVAQWQDVHVQSVVPNQRYLMHAATALFGYPEPAGAEA